MDSQPQSSEPLTSEPSPSPRRGWRNGWGALLLVLIALLGTCGYWMLRHGVVGAIGLPQFWYVVFGAVIVGICLMGRWSMSVLSDGGAIDDRTATLTAGRGRWMTRSLPGSRR